jgi:non-specific protein-tyrosine kinase
MTSIRDYLDVVRQRWLIVLVTIVVATGGAVAFSLQQTPEYEARARVLIETASPDPTLGVSSTNVLTEAELIRSEVVADRVRAELDLTETTDDILEKITVRPPSQADVLEVSARTVDPAEATNLANAFASEYVAFRSEKVTERVDLREAELAEALVSARERTLELDHQLERLPRNDPQRELVRIERNQALRRLATLQEQHDALLDHTILAGTGSQVIQFASIPSEPASPGQVQAGILGFLLSIPLAIGLALVRDAMSDKIKTKDEAEALTGSQTLALVPFDAAWQSKRAHHIAVRADPGSVVAEAYRTLRVNLEFVGKSERTGAVLVTSPGAGEGKTATSINLAMAFAEAGRQTMLIDADLRRPRAHRFLGTDLQPGLAEILDGQAPPVGSARSIDPNLRFIPSGLSDTPDRALGTREATGVLHDLTRNVDVAIVDAPAILGAAEASVLASDCDGVVLVIFAGTTQRSAAARAAEQIRRVGGRLLGLVLIGAPADDYRAERPVRANA